MAVALLLLELSSANSLHTQRVFRDWLNPLDAYSDTEFITRYRITRSMFVQLHENIAESLIRCKSRSHSLPTILQLAVALQPLATGSFQTVVGTSHGISQPSVSRCIATVSDALCLHAKEFIVFPNQQEQVTIQQSFQEKDGFPLVLGCIDCSHVNIVAPAVNEETFVNRKNEYFINIQAICDCDLKFIDIVARWPGCTHDAFTWRQSGLNQKISSGEISIIDGWFLGDSAYPLTQNF